MKGWSVGLLVGLAVIATATTYAVAGTRHGNVIPDSHTSQWLSLHGREAVADVGPCRKCHTKVTCSTCHLAEWPHPMAWQEVHGATALASQFRGCSLCHPQEFCLPCHGGVEIPHSSDFQKRHSRGNENADACPICHSDADCEQCHQLHGSHRSGGLVPR